MIINNSYLITDELLPTAELGSFVFNPTSENFYIVTDQGVLTRILPEFVKEILASIEKGGEIEISQKIDAPTAIQVTSDTTIINNGMITISEDTVGDGVFKVTAGKLTLEGEGTINGVGKNDWNMAVWATENGEVVINDGYFTNEGATATNDPAHFDLIYASGSGQIEINGGEFKCETPKWTLNIKDKDRETAKIVVKGGKFHGFNPADCEVEGEHTNFVAEGYEVKEENGIFKVEQKEASAE